MGSLDGKRCHDRPFRERLGGTGGLPDPKFAYDPSVDEQVRDSQSEVTGEVVVAGSRCAECFRDPVLAQGTHLSSWRDGLKRLDCMRDVAVCEPKKAVTAAVVDDHDACFEQNTEVFTCRGRRNAGLSCKFPRRDGAITQ